MTFRALTFAVPVELLCDSHGAAQYQTLGMSLEMPPKRNGIRSRSVPNLCLVGQTVLFRVSGDDILIAGVRENRDHHPPTL